MYNERLRKLSAVFIVFILSRHDGDDVFSVCTFVLLHRFYIIYAQSFIRTADFDPNPSPN